MTTHEELVSCIIDLAQRAGPVESAELHAAQDVDFREGRRTEVRRSINDEPLATVAFLERLRKAVEEAQSALLANMPRATSGGPTLTELGAALSISKQSGRKRAEAASKWAAEHDLPSVDFTIEDLGVRYPARGEVTGAESVGKMHWPDDGTIPPDFFGNTGRSQAKLANKALAMGIGINGYR